MIQVNEVSQGVSASPGKVASSGEITNLYQMMNAWENGMIGFTKLQPI